MIAIYIIAGIAILMLFTISSLKIKEEPLTEREWEEFKTKKGNKKIKWGELEHAFLLNFLFFRKSYKEITEKKQVIMKLKERTLNRLYTKVVTISLGFASIMSLGLALQKKLYLAVIFFIGAYFITNAVLLLIERKKLETYLKIMSNESISIMMKYATFYKSHKNPMIVLRKIIKDTKKKEISRQLEHLVKHIEKSDKSFKESLTEYKMTLKNSAGFEFLCEIIQISMDSENFEDKVTDFSRSLTNIEILEKERKISTAISIMSLDMILLCMIPSGILMAAPTLFSETDGVSIWKVLVDGFKN